MNGFASDYAFLIQGLLDLYEASFDVHRLEWAIKLQDRQSELFWDEKQSGYFTTTGKDPNVLLRMKEDYDGAEPSPDSVAALNLLRLAAMFDQADSRSRAEKLLQAYGAPLKAQPAALPQMLVAVDWYRSRQKQIVIAGKEQNAGTEAMLREVRSHFIPNKVLILADGGEGQKFFAERVEFMQSVTPVKDQATAYVCENFVCQLPTPDLKKLAELLTAAKPHPLGKVSSQGCLKNHGRAAPSARLDVN